MSSRKLLDQYVTNSEGQVFAIKNLQGMIGAVMARYSRTEGGLRETLLREFIKEDQLNPKKAGKLIERVLIAYGDDSVGELEGAHLSFESISMLATKVIEHRRIGGSPIEQSTRYVRYDFKDETTGYHYYLPESIECKKGRAFFQDRMDRIFDRYSEMWKPLESFLKKRKPMEEAVYDLGDMGSRYEEMATSKQQTAFKRTWKNDIKTKTCDILRSFLPLATRANVGLFGNGRFFQHLISKMLSSSLKEANQLGSMAFDELSKIIPHYVKRAEKIPYLMECNASMAAIAEKYFSNLDPKSDDQIQLVEPDHQWIAELVGAMPNASSIKEAMLAEADLNFLTALVFSHVRGSFHQIRDHLKTLPAQAHKEIMDSYYGQRKARRNRPERGIEYGYPYTFDLVTEWAVYKDLMRHRMGTIQIQPMAPDLGFEMPIELEEAGLLDIARETVELAGELYYFLAEHHPDEREYAMLQGHRVRWSLAMNDRALMHLVELRSAPQGHINYRRAAQEMHRLAGTRHPQRAERMSFVNYEESYWSRSQSEARQRVKESQLED